MSVLVAYASKHGSTAEIAERIAGQLRQRGKQAEARPLEDVKEPGSYEALVIGSALYYGSWMKEATEWVHSNQAVLAGRPVWLFSVGPLGTEVKDAEQQPRELAAFQRDHRTQGSPGLLRGARPSQALVPRTDGGEGRQSARRRFPRLGGHRFLGSGYRAGAGMSR